MPDPIEIVSVHVVARKGAEFGRVVRAALEIAVAEWRNVDVLFNDRTYRILVNDLMATVRERPESP